MSDKKKFLQVIDEKANIITDVSDRIWEYAELSLLEYKSWLCHLLVICMTLGKLYKLYFSVSFVKWQ